jgi:hypothetical protein
MTARSPLVSPVATFPISLAGATFDGLAIGLASGPQGCPC